MKKLIKKVLMTLISLFKWEKKIPILYAGMIRYNCLIIN